MAIKEYLNTQHVFSMKDFKEAFPDSVTDLNLLARAAGNGRVDRVRRGLFVSRADRFFDIEPNPVSVAQNAADDAIFCYMTALQLHGVLHNITFNTQFYTCHHIPAFQYGGVSYKPILLGNREVDAETIYSPGLISPVVTTREQTLVDCLSRVSLAGGPENLLRSIGAFRYLNVGKTIGVSRLANASTRARLGWLLENTQDQLGADEATLDQLQSSIGRGPYYFYKPNVQERFWIPRWKLYLPVAEEEMLSWLRT